MLLSGRGSSPWSASAGASLMNSVMSSPRLTSADQADEAIGVRVAEPLAGLEPLGLGSLDHEGKVGDPGPERRADA